MKKAIISIKDLTKLELFKIFELADRRTELFHEYCNSLNHKIVGTLFFQPSTRTQLSLQSAFMKLGGQQIGFSNIEDSRSGNTYHENMEDLGRVLNTYCDVAVMRHYDENAIYELATVTDIPLISAGNGNDEHPTQAAIDLYTIKRETGHLDNIHILFIGTIPSRSMNSLILGLNMWENVTVHIIGNNTNILPAWKKYNVHLYHSINDFIKTCQDLKQIEIIYITEIKNSTSNYNYVFTEKDFALFPNAKILCPLPRTKELPKYFDYNQNSIYFNQANNGIFVRAALYLLLMNVITI